MRGLPRRRRNQCLASHEDHAFWQRLNPSLYAGAFRRALAPYLIFARHSFSRSSSERTCASIASCNASMPLLDSSAEAFLSRFCFQSRIACFVALWASNVALEYSFMQASAIEHVWHSWAAAGLERSRASIAVG